MPCTRESKDEIGKNEMCARITSTLDGKGGRGGTGFKLAGDRA
jgi:hypothetical protein